MSKSPSLRRIQADIRELALDPSDRYHAAPLEHDMFEWHFTIRGADETEFSGGIYHGRILLPPDYPFKPPHIIFLTKSGRFEINQKICLSFSAYHPELWQPAWGIRLILEALISFLPTPADGALGALNWSIEERKKLAKESINFFCPTCQCHVKNLLPQLKPKSDTNDKSNNKPKSRFQKEIEQLQLLQMQEHAKKDDKKDEKESVGETTNTDDNKNDNTEESKDSTTTEITDESKVPAVVANNNNENVITEKDNKTDDNINNNNDATTTAKKVDGGEENNNNSLMSTDTTQQQQQQQKGEATTEGKDEITTLSNRRQQEETEIVVETNLQQQQQQEQQQHNIQQQQQQQQAPVANVAPRVVVAQQQQQVAYDNNNNNNKVLDPILQGIILILAIICYLLLRKVQALLADLRALNE